MLSGNFFKVFVPIMLLIVLLFAFLLIDPLDFFGTQPPPYVPHIERSEYDIRLEEAQAGDADAQLWLGMRYFHGRDFARALTWLEQAAGQNNGDALLQLGIMYAQPGNGVAQNDTTAADYVLRAAQAGNRMAMEMIANWFEDGRGVTQSDSEAAYWRTRAAGAPATQTPSEDDDEDEEEAEGAADA